MQPLQIEFGDRQDHPFHGNQYTGGIGGSDKDGTSGDTIKGMVGNRLLRAAMIRGLSTGGRNATSMRPRLIDAPESWTTLTDANEVMRGGAKGEVVAAAGADIAKAAVEDPAVRAEFEAFVQMTEGELIDQEGQRYALEAQWQDRQHGNWTDAELAAKSDEQIFGEILAQDYVDSWASSAADHEPVSLALQQTATDVLNARSSSFDHYLESDTPGDQDVMFARQGMEDYLRREGATMRAFVQGEYDRTQAFLKDNGITEVTLHRGFSSGVSYPEPGPQKIDMNPASSWSVDRETAVDFASGEEKNSYVLTMTVPASDIVSTARTGRGALHEGEVLVRNQPNSVAYVGATEEDAYGGAYVDPPDYGGDGNSPYAQDEKYA